MKNIMIAGVLGLVLGFSSLQAGDITDGSKLYAKCTACHGQKGEKKALGKSAIINTLDKETLVADLTAYKAGTLNQKGMGALMKGQTALLSEAEINTLAEYITQLK